MIQVICFRFHQYNENTFLVFDQTKECVIIDPGCYSSSEKDELTSYIGALNLKPKYILNTHCHIDHVFGNAFLMNYFQVPLSIPAAEGHFLEAMPKFASRFGFAFEPVTKGWTGLKEGDKVCFGTTQLQVISTPGHSPDSMSFYDEHSGTLFGGDVLFRNRIGRVDLPGGDYETLCKSINNKLFALDNKTIVYSGHGVSTQIGYERKTSRFLCWTKN
jgi:hydroxyacylglutathione hydrolase